MATWNFTVNNAYLENSGDSATGLIEVLRAGAEVAPSHDVQRISDALTAAGERLSVALAAPEVERIAGNLALHDLETVVVSSDAGEEIARIPVANDVSSIPMEERSDNVHLEPQDPRRPTIS